MLFQSNSLLFAGSHGRSPSKRFSNRRPRLESLETRTVLSTVSGVTAADAPVGDPIAVDEQSPALIGGVSTDPSIGHAAGASTDCLNGTTNVFDHFDWSQALFEQETAKEKLEGLEAKLNEQEFKLLELEVKLEGLEGERAKLGREYQAIQEAIADAESSDEEAKLLEDSKKKDAELDKVEDDIETTKGEMEKLKTEVETLKAEIEKLKQELGRDQDGDALPDDSSAEEAADGASLLGACLLGRPVVGNIDADPEPEAYTGSPLDLVTPLALAEAYWGDVGTAHLERFSANQDLDAVAAALASQGAEGDLYNFLSLDNDTGAIDFSSGNLSELDNDTGAIDFTSGAVEMPPDLLPLWR